MTAVEVYEREEDGGAGLWDYDDDVPPPVEDNEEDFEVVVVGDTEEERGKRGRGRLPGCSGGNKKQQDRPAKKQRLQDQVLTIDEDDDDDSQPSPAKADCKLSIHQRIPKRIAKLGSVGAVSQPKTTTAPPPPLQLLMSSQTLAYLEQSNRVMQLQQAEEEDGPSPLKGDATDGRQHGAAATSAHLQQVQVPHLQALSAKARAVEAQLRREQQRREELLQQQQLQGESLHGEHEGAASLPGAASQACAPVEGPRITVICQHKDVEIKLRIAPSQPVSMLLQAFKRQMCAKGKGGALPDNDDAFRIDFDGDRLSLDVSMEQAGIDDEDRLDVMWK